MGNSLLRGSGSAETSAPEPIPSTIPTFGYRAGEARIFQLSPGEELPEGWVDSPAKVADEDKPKRVRARKGGGNVDG